MKVNAMTGTWLSDARALRSLLPSETERAAMAICEVRRGYTCYARPLRSRDQSLEPRPLDRGRGAGRHRPRSSMDRGRSGAEARCATGRSAACSPVARLWAAGRKGGGRQTTVPVAAYCIAVRALGQVDVCGLPDGLERGQPAGAERKPA
jgi:hypothetical protein